MKTFFLISPLLGAASFPKSINTSARESITPAAKLDAMKNEKSTNFPNGTSNVPVQKMPSKELSTLSYKEYEMHFLNSSGEKKIYTKGTVDIEYRMDFCDCISELMQKNPSKKFIEGVEKCLCSKSDFEHGKTHRSPSD